MSEPVFCNRCNGPVPSNSKFCNFCGARIKKRSAASEFFISILKSIGFFAVFNFIRNLVDALYIIFVRNAVVAASPNGMAGVTQEMLYEKYSYFAPETAILASFLVILCFSVFFRAKKRRLTKEIKVKRMPVSSFFAVAILGFSAQIMIAVFLSALYSACPELSDGSYSKIYELMYKHSNPYTKFAYVAIVTPVIEEILFRGLIHTNFKKGMPTALAVVLSSLFFGLAHGNTEQLGYTFLVGLLMALAYEKYDSLWAPIAIHAAFNGSNFLLQSLNFSNNAYYLILLFAGIGLFFIISAFVFFTKMTAVSELSKAKELSDYEAL